MTAEAAGVSGRKIIEVPVKAKEYVRKSQNKLFNIEICKKGCYRPGCNSCLMDDSCSDFTMVSTVFMVHKLICNLTQILPADRCQYHLQYFVMI